jgi:DNA-binding IclR family transcriptional regulator
MSTLKSPPTRRVIDVLDALACATNGLTSTDIARTCGISTSTCALMLAELENSSWIARHTDRRYVLGSGIFPLVHGLRRQFPLLDRGRDALTALHERLGAACSMSKIDARHLTTIDTVGHADGEHAVGEHFPIDPPFGLVAMAWREPDVLDRWLRGVTPRLSQSDLTEQTAVLSDIHARGYGAWRFDDAHSALQDRLSQVLASVETTGQVSRRLITLMTMVTLRSVTRTLEKDLATAEFVVVPLFGRDGQPDYQIEIRLTEHAFSLDDLNAAIRAAQDALSNPAPSEA